MFDALLTSAESIGQPEPAASSNAYVEGLGSLSVLHDIERGTVAVVMRFCAETIGNWPILRVFS